MKPLSDEFVVRPHYRKARNENAYKGGKGSLSKQIRQACSHSGGVGFGSKGGRQGCTLKGRIGKGGKAGKAHLSYIQRNGTGIDGGEPELLGNVRIDEMSEGKQIRLIVSPENYKGVDFPKLAESLVTHIEHKYKLSLRWVGAVHFNTLHPHLHIVIDTKGKNNKQVFIPRDFFRGEGREYLRDTLTAILGKRQVIQGAPPAYLTRNGPTKIDSFIEEHIQRTEGNLKASFYHNASFSRALPASVFIERIHHLKKLELVKVDTKGAITFEPNWMDSLKAMSRYESFLDASQHLISTNRAALSIYDPTIEKPVRGVITYVGGKSNELSDSACALVECYDKRAFFVEIPYPSPFDKGERVVIGSMQFPGRRPQVVVRHEFEEREKQENKSGRVRQ
jgi:hypothetical protein